MARYFDQWLGEEVEEEDARYTIIYVGYLFDGDNDGLNSHDTDSWDEAIGIYNAYPDIVSIRDNWYSVTLANDEWN